MHIAIFGGTFNPPHKAHQHIAKYIVDHHLGDQVWYVPVFQHPWAQRMNKQRLTSYQHRLKMLQLIKQPPQISVQEFQAVSYTYDTLEYFQKLHPQDQFSWVMGSEYIKKWPDFLATHPKLDQYNIFVYPRQGSPLESIYPNMTLLHDAPLVTISSTQIRQILSSEKNRSLRRTVLQSLNPKVLNYIQTQDVY